MKTLVIKSVGCALFFVAIMQAYNVSYNGNDAYESYETSWGKERFVKQDYIKYFPYYKKYQETLAQINPLLIRLKDLPQPYNQLDVIKSFNSWGMYFNYNFIKKLFDHNPHILKVIEIGSFYGLSTRHIASLLPDTGRLYAVDSWLYHHGMYEQFLSNVVLTGLCTKIIPVKARSDQAIYDLKNLGMKFDLIYVDGDHETQGVLTDLELYYPVLSEHGVICGDDWLLSTVRMAVQLFAQKHGLTIYGSCNFWFLKDEGAYQQKDFLEVDDSAWKF